MEKESITCPYCGHIYESIPVKCVNCKYPFTASEKEKSIFIGQQISKKGVISDSKKKIKIVKIILLVLGIGSVLFALQHLFLSSRYPYYFHMYPFIMILQYINIVIGCVLIGCAFLAKKHPVISTAIPLGILTLLYILIIIVNPRYMLIGIIWKAILFSVLAYGFFNSLEAQNISKESNYLNTHKDNENKKG